MKKTSDILSKIAYVIAGLILLYLSVNAIHYSYGMNLYYYEGISFIREGPDSRLKSIVVVVLAFFVLFGLAKLLFIKAKDDDKRNKRVLILALVFSGLILTGLIYYVVRVRFLIECDQYEVFTRALLFAKGDYSPVSDYYFQMYKQQIGLAFYESLFLKFTSDHLIFQIFNAFFIAGAVFFVYRLSHELFEDPYISFFTLMLTVICFPLYYYVSFVYGDVFMIFASLFISWSAIKWIKTKKAVFPVLFLLTTLVMVPVRKNSVVFLMALSIMLILTALKEKKSTALILAVFSILLPLVFNGIVLSYYETKAGSKIENEMPAVNWIAMGLYEAVNENCSVGVYNMYNELTYFSAGRDKEASSKASRAFIDERIEFFKNNPIEARRFFRFKILEQWAEPTFSSIDSTVGLHKMCWEEVRFSYDFHTLDNMSKATNYLQSFVYIFALIYMIFAVFSKERPGRVLLPVAFIGGFLFSLLWEASGRYVFPYFILLIPLAAAAAGKSFNLCAGLLKKIAKKEN